MVFQGENKCQLVILWAVFSIRVIAVEFVYSLAIKREDDLKSCKRYSSTFAKFYVIIVSCEDIYGSYCFQKCNNDRFHTQLVSSVLNSCPFPVAYNKQNRPRFPQLAKFITCLPTEAGIVNKVYY